MRRYGPVLVLFALAPLVAELLFGATPISRIGGLLPESLLYGGGALLVRELARRRGAGWGRVALLGAAYGIVEEGLALQSMFNPDLFNAGVVGGRALGVNWVWSQWTIGYHVVWSIGIPILLAELLFPARRAAPWLGKAGLAAVAALYALGVLAIGAIFRLFVAPGFAAPLSLMVGAALVAAALVAVALGWPAREKSPAAAPQPGAHAPAAWQVALLAALAAAAWFALLDLPHALREGALALLPMLAALALVAALVVGIRRWSASQAWSDLHRLALASGALLISMLFGLLFVTAGSPVDQLGQGCLSLAALGLLAWFAARLRRRPNPAGRVERASAL